MNYYKHYSFDLWLTLIKSNPDFKKQRALYFFKNYNSQKKTILEIETIFREVDLMCNSINEKTGKNLDSDEMYLIVLSQINNSNDFSGINFDDLYREIEIIFFNYLPVLYNEETIITLDKLKNESGSSFNILSNTAFIKGSSLKQVLNHYQISKYFDFQLYSDEIGVSKPNKTIFELMVQKAMDTQKNSTLTRSECLHIGDNFIADIQGAENIGLHSYQINSNSNTIVNLLNQCA